MVGEVTAVDKILKLATRPNSCDMIIFGDLFIGEVWFQADVIENTVPMYSIQWEPENELMNFLKNSEKGKKYIDKETGRTITLMYPKSRVFYRIGEKRWFVFTNWASSEMINFDLDKRLIEKNETLEKENQLLMNEVGYLYSELEKTSTRFEEQLRVWAGRFKIANSTRGDMPPEMNPENPQANYMGDGNG